MIVSISSIGSELFTIVRTWWANILSASDLCNGHNATPGPIGDSYQSILR